MRACIFYLILVIFAAQFSLVTADARQVVKSQNLSAHVSDSFQCSEQISLIIQAPNSTFFTKNSSEFQRLVGSARLVLGFECKSIKKIIIIGKVNNQAVYQGKSFATENWVVINNGEKSVQTQKKLESAPVKSLREKLVAGGEQKLIVKGTKNTVIAVKARRTNQPPNIPETPEMKISAPNEAAVLQSEFQKLFAVYNKAGEIWGRDISPNYSGSPIVLRDLVMADDHTLTGKLHHPYQLLVNDFILVENNGQYSLQIKVATPSNKGVRSALLLYVVEGDELVVRSGPLLP